MNVRSITAYALALAFLALSGRAAFAQDRGQRRGQDRPPDTTSSANGAQGAQPLTDADRQAEAEAAERRAMRDGAEQKAKAERDRRVAKEERDRRVAKEEQDRRVAKEEQDRRAMEGRSNPNAQGRSDGQNRGQDRNYNGQDRDQDRSYNGQDRRLGERNFTDRDRQLTRQWYQQHRNRLGPGWRQRDRLDPSWERRLVRGYRLDSTLRQRMYWLPPDLARLYGPAPRGYRYAIIGGNIVLLDDFYQVHDVFRLELNF